MYVCIKINILVLINIKVQKFVSKKNNIIKHV